jgi:hypothetical protein
VSAVERIAPVPSSLTVIACSLEHARQRVTIAAFSGESGEGHPATWSRERLSPPHLPQASRPLFRTVL